MNLVYILGGLVFCSSCVLSAPQPYSNSSKYSPGIQKIISAASADGIDLVGLPFASAAFAGIEDAQKRIKINNTVKSERIDVHGTWVERLFRLCRDGGLSNYSSTCDSGMVCKLDTCPPRDRHPSSTMEYSEPSRIHGRQR